MPADDSSKLDGAIDTLTTENPHSPGNGIQTDIDGVFDRDTGVSVDDGLKERGQ